MQTPRIMFGRMDNAQDGKNNGVSVVPRVLNLDDELASLIRVRNRLAQSPDASLPRILTRLLPKLLKKLDDNSGVLSDESVMMSAKELTGRQQMQGHMVGICSHAIERVKGRSYHTDENDWMDAIQGSLLECQSQLARTMTLAVLQTGISARATTDMQKVDRGGYHWWPLATLFQFVDRLSRKLALTESTFADEDSSEQEEEELQQEAGPQPKQSDQLDLYTASWLVLDIIAIQVQLPLMLDWDMVRFHPSHYKEPDTGNGIPSGATGQLSSIIKRDGVGMFDWILDLSLFYSQLPARMGDTGGDGMSTFGRCRIVHRRKQSQRWTEDTHSLLKELAYAAFQFAVLPTEGTCLLDDERRLLLCILMSCSRQSKTGMLASTVLNRAVGRDRVARASGKLARADKIATCSLSLNVALLILVLGDKLANEVLKPHAHHRHLWEGILGPRPTVQSLQRSSLRLAMAEGAVQFMGQNFVLSQCGSAVTVEELKVFVDLVVAVQSHTSSVSWSAIHVMYGIYVNIEDFVGSTLQQDEEWLTDFFDKCLSACVALLTNMKSRLRPSRNGTANEEAGEELRRRAQLDDAGGPLQPADAEIQDGRRFMLRHVARRRNQDLLFENHRKAQRCRSFKHQDAREARKVAYNLLKGLFRNRREQSLMDNEGSFHVPILLFQCLSFEEETMVPFVDAALSALLDLYADVFDSNEGVTSCAPNEVATRDSSTFLPTLVEAVCGVSPCARFMAAKWIGGFLRLVDPLASYHLCTYLAEGEEKAPREEAKRILKFFRRSEMEEQIVRDMPEYVFVDVKSQDGQDFIFAQLQQMITIVVEKCHVPEGAAAVLLWEFGYDVDRILRAVIENRAVTLKEAGVYQRSSLVEDKETSKQTTLDEAYMCEICYTDNVPAEELYSLPCGHKFCLSCWESFLTNKAEESTTQLLTASCPSQDCIERVVASDMSAVAQELFPTWRKVFVHEFLDRDASWRLCPGPDCPMATNYISSCGGNVCCSTCNTKFCFKCGNEPHNPAKCVDYDRWSKLFGGSKVWIKMNTKPCPGCDSPIEKNNGCNHMTCSRCSCKFCWLCGGRLDTFSAPHSCNRYVPSEHAESDAERRLLFYSERYQAHAAAEILTRGHLQAFDDEMQDAVDHIGFLSEKEAEVLENTRQRLVTFRKFVQHSYVALFGLDNADEDRRKSFEDQQAAVELFVENLARLSQMKLEAVYKDRGEYGMRMHVRSIAFYTLFVSHYMERMENCLK